MAKSKRKPTDSGNKADKPDDARPYWVPAGVRLDDMPAELQAAIAAVINPVYEDVVLSSNDGLEKSIGTTVCHLLWLEVLSQFELGRLVFVTDSESGDEERQEAIARHIRLAQAKLKASGLLHRLREFARRWGGPLSGVSKLRNPMGPLEAFAAMGPLSEEQAETIEATLENDEIR